MANMFKYLVSFVLFIATDVVISKQYDGYACIKSVIPSKSIIKNEKIEPTQLEDVSSFILQSSGVAPLMLDHQKYFASRPDSRPSSSFVFVIDENNYKPFDKESCHTRLQLSSSQSYLDFSYFIDSMLTLPASVGSVHLLDFLSEKNSTSPSRISVSFNKKASRALVGSFPKPRNTFAYSWDTQSRSYKNDISNSDVIEALSLNYNDILERFPQVAKEFCSSVNNQCFISEGKVLMNNSENQQVLSIEDPSDFKFLAELIEINAAIESVPLNNNNNGFFLFAISTLSELPSQDYNKQALANTLLSGAMNQWEKRIENKFSENAVINVITRIKSNTSKDSVVLAEAVNNNNNGSDDYNPNYVVFFHIFLWLAVFLVVVLWLTIYMTATIDPDYSSIIFRTTDTRLKND